MPIFPETSTLRSPRDPDVMSRYHIKHTESAYNLNAIMRAMSQLQQTVNRLRLRGGSQPSGSVTWFMGEYDPTLAYSPQQMVIISMGDDSGAYVCTEANGPPSPQSPWLGGGFWVQLPNGGNGNWS